MEIVKYNDLEIELIMKEMLVWDNRECNAPKKFVLCRVIGGKAEYIYKCIDSEGYSEYYKNAKEIEATTPKVRTIEDGLKYGDIVIDSYGYKSKVLSICGDVIILSMNNKFEEANSSNYTLHELIKYGCKLYQEPVEKIKEITIEEAKDLLQKQGIKIINL